MGSVHAYTTKAGKKLYRISYRRPDHSQTTERGFTRKVDAELRLAEVELGKAKGDYVNPADAREDLASIAAGWLRAREQSMKPSSYRMVRSAWSTHVEPVWGARKVGSVQHSEVQDWVSQLASQRSATTVLRAYGVLASLLDVALKDRRVSRNVARGVALPRKVAKSKPYLTHAQVQRLAEESAHPTLVLFLAYTGLRWGEATGLRVKHVNTLRRRVSVEENAVLVDGVIHTGTPKSHGSRSVPYPAFLELPIAKLCEGKTRDALLFGDGLVHMLPPNSVRGWFAGAVKRVQDADAKAAAAAKARGDEEPPIMPRVTPHDLRHTAASLAISSGANVKAVQRMLGHSSAAMTLDTYADLFDDDLDDVAAALDQARQAAVVVKVLSPGS
ncbi:site-specific integrase [Microbacterium esteraromaticum]|uniref:tyrosine-type recombinase/integrase n=1 Tax=Microbacterium esteraromaticum TaxID=57043 RepID=UPI001C938F22|nr:site-specific integrase [Microbacterium esteraromaticum]MBY6061601.1 site-specific integrase [Microbacterium esteraromaticum]